MYIFLHGEREGGDGGGIVGRRCCRELRGVIRRRWGEVFPRKEWRMGLYGWEEKILFSL